MRQLVCKKCQVDFVGKAGQVFCSKACATSYRNKINDPNFLKTDNMDLKWYLIGLIFADGCLSKQKDCSERITIVLTDRDIIDTLNPIVCPERKVYVQKGRKEAHSDAYGLINTNPAVLAELKSLGLVQRKSTVINFPKVESPRSFIRGYFDGNGCVRKMPINKIDYGYLQISFTTGSENFAFGLKDLLEIFSYHPKLTYDNRHHAMYIKLHRQAEIISFRNWIYEDTNLFIKRKYNLFYGDIV